MNAAKIGLVAGAFMGLAAMAAALNWDIPTPAWDTDIRTVQAQIKSVDQLATQEALGAVQLRIYQNRREQNTIRTEKQPVPDYLLKEQVALEEKQRRLQRRLDGL